MHGYDAFNKNRNMLLCLREELCRQCCQKLHTFVKQMTGNCPFRVLKYYIQLSDVSLLLV